MCFSTLVNLFQYDIDLPRGAKSRCPSRADFVAQVFPQLEELRTTVLKEVAAGICGAVNITATSISAEASTPDDDNPAVGNSAAAEIPAAGNSAAAGISTAGISAAGISSAAVKNSSAVVDNGEESPMLVEEGSQVVADESLITLERLKVSNSEDDISGSGVNGSSRDDENKKALIDLSKTCE